ncbi:MAG TPA: dockerin type I domain-containing protein [Armatimonadota bacterium]|jgi:hypothetical protein
MKSGFRAAIWAAGALLLTGPTVAATVSVAGPSSATPGGVLTVDVALSSDLNGVYALQGALQYDPAALTPLPNQDASAAQAYYAGALPPYPGETIPKDADLFRMNSAQTGLIIFGYVKNPSNPAGSASLTVPPTALRLNFNVAATAAGSTTLRLAPYAVNGKSLPAILVGGPDGSAIDAITDAGLNVALGTLRRAGDVNADGVVDVADVVLLMQMASGMPTPTGVTVDQRSADVWPAGGPDGAITLADALRVARFVSGLETGLN